MVEGPSGEHKRQAAEAGETRSVACAVLTVSDTRTLDTDQGGATIVRMLDEAGHRVVDRAIVKDEVSQIGRAIEAWLGQPDIQCVLTTGGTGIGSRDTTIEVVGALLTAELPGFGELFRMLSWEQVGAAAMLSRAVGGLVSRAGSEGGTNDTFVFAMPGSVNAVETAMRGLIVPELSHLVWERKK
jgi:molybdopterin adenylyltransferase